MKSGHNFISIKIKNRKEKERGIFIQEGEDWILLQSLFTDFMVDGFKIISKNYILSIDRDEHDAFVEEVLISCDKLSIPGMTIPLKTYPLFEFLMTNQKTFQLFLNKENSSYIGNINKLLAKSFYLNPFGKKVGWLDYYLLFRMDFIRLLAIDTDYINSLLAYNKRILNSTH